jgi:tetratricopeptide (TPR) repeat protein
VLDQFDLCIASAEQALAITDDPATSSSALTARAWVHTARGEHEEAVRDMERARELARDLEPAMLCAVLQLEAQARRYAGQLDLAADQLAEAECIGGPVDAMMLWRLDTIYGDLAMKVHRPHEALDYYTRSLEAAQARGDDLQVLFDLMSVALGCAVLGDDAGAHEAAGLAEAQGTEVGGPGSSTVAHLLGGDQLTAAEGRAGVAAAELKTRGRSVPATNRVARACELARAQQPA